MVSVVTKIGTLAMLSTRALSRELTPTSPEQELGDAFVGLLTDLRVEIDEMSGMLDSLQSQMDLIESK